MTEQQNEGPKVTVPELKTGGTHAEEMRMLNATLAQMEASNQTPVPDLTTQPEVKEAPTMTAKVMDGTPEGIIKAETLQPQTTEATAQPTDAKVTIPEKFQKTDGTLNEEALKKSTADVEAALERYRSMERELKQRQNAAKRGFPQPEANVQAQPQQQAQNQQPITEPRSFEEAIELQVKQRGLGATLAELTRIAAEDARTKALAEIAEIREETAWQKRERDLRGVMQNAPELLSDDVAKELSKRIESTPHLQHAANPWTAALKEYLGEQELNKRTGRSHGNRNPTPTGPAAPQAPVGPATIPQAKPELDISKLDADTVVKATKNLKASDLQALLGKMGVRVGH